MTTEVSNIGEKVAVIAVVHSEQNCFFFSWFTIQAFLRKLNIAWQKFLVSSSKSTRYESGIFQGDDMPVKIINLDNV